MEFRTGKESQGQIETEDEEGKENSGRKASSCTGGVSALYPPTQVLTLLTMSHTQKKRKEKKHCICMHTHKKISEAKYLKKKNK